MFKTHKRAVKIILFISLIILFTTKIICDYLPFFIIKNAFSNSLNNYRSGFLEPFKKSDTINLKLDYKTSDGKTKKLYTIFHDSVFGFSLGDSNDVYYTIPYKKIKNVLKSNKIHLSSFSEKLSVKNINPINSPSIKIKT